MLCPILSSFFRHNNSAQINIAANLIITILTLIYIMFSGKMMMKQLTLLTTMGFLLLLSTSDSSSAFRVDHDSSLTSGSSFGGGRRISSLLPSSSSSTDEATTKKPGAADAKSIVQPENTSAVLGVVPRGGAFTSTPGTVDAFFGALDILGTGVFALSGALTAGKRGMDLLGMVIISTITATGGGTVRDMMLDSGAVFWIRDPVYFKICVAVTLATFVAWPTIEKKTGFTDSNRIICVADAVGLGAFCVLATQKAAEEKLRPVMWIVVGLVSSVFGGVTRDVLCMQNPRIMYPHKSMYAFHPLLGATLYTLMRNNRYATLCPEKAACIAFVVAVTSRILSFDSPIRLPHWNEQLEPRVRRFRRKQQPRQQQEEKIA